MSEIRIENLKKTFGNFTALDIPELAFDEKSYLTVLGPSGSGKTTLLRIIAGLENADSGRMAVDGKDILDSPPWKRSIGLVFQNYALYPHLTVFQNIATPLIQLKMDHSEIDRKIYEISNIMGLDDKLAKLPKELSGGQQQRVALARAVIKRPNILLLDEPLSNLDAKVRVDLRDYLKKIQKDFELTAIHVTHDQVEGMALGDSMVIIHKGKIEQTGKPEELYRHPKTRFVSGFVGEINIIDGKTASMLTGMQISTDIGIRYEDIIPDLSGPFTGKVVENQFMGSRRMFTFLYNGTRMRCFAERDHLSKLQGELKFRVANENLIFFQQLEEEEEN
ncbi:MAG: ABC transporter ATP-binding protein [Candidatus Thermoplasmatota archaeon]|nr:ABC transporter ATP-binding protein [Candidatus Thermoplasmatota archaeon]